jgi:hypothetical protein
MESSPGRDKDPEEIKEFNNALARTMVLDRQMGTLYKIEESIYGKKIEPYLK